MANAAMQLDIPRETIAKLLNNHWTWIHPLLMFVYRPAFISMCLPSPQRSSELC